MTNGNCGPRVFLSADRGNPAGSINSGQSETILRFGGTSPSRSYECVGIEEDRQTYVDSFTYPSGSRRPASRSSQLPKAANTDVMIKPPKKKVGTAGSASIGVVALTPFIAIALGINNAKIATSNATANQKQTPTQKTTLNSVPKSRRLTAVGSSIAPPPERDKHFAARL
jgi:hypothetical protein